MAYQIDNCGLLIGLTSIPFGQEKGFQDHIRDKVFDRYKKNLIKLSSSNDGENPDFKKCFYEPTPYFLFGSFDLAVLSLVDDFTLANRIFHPHATTPTPGEVGESYNYQMIIGSHPLTSKENGGTDLITRAKDTFLRGKEKKRYPFIGITTLKLNNMMLCCGGLNYYEAVIRWLKDTLKAAYVHTNSSYIILETYSWHELTIVNFSDSLESIAKAVLNVRESAVAELVGSGFNTENYSDFLNSVFESSVENGKVHLHDSHIFLSTDTVMGVDYDLFLKYMDDMKHVSPTHFPLNQGREHDTQQVNFSTNWEVKPGHLSAFATSIMGKLDKHLIDLTIGDGLYIDPKKRLDLPSLIHQKLARVTESQVHLHKLKTQPTFQISLGDIKKTTCDPSTHPRISRRMIEVLTFSSPAIQEVKTNLRKLNVSAVLRERILNMYYDYNTGIRDSALFIYFLELHRFLIFTSENIERISKKGISGSSKKDFHNYFFRLTQYFEQAFNNRFHISSQMEHLTDFNMDYNGGMQQFISAIDAAYKNVAGLTGEYQKDRGEASPGENDLPSSFALVTGYPSVDSLEYAVRLNYFHFLQPMFFGAVACHESANFISSRLSRHKGPKTTIATESDTQSDISPTDPQTEAFKNVVIFWTQLKNEEYKTNLIKKIGYIVSQNNALHPEDRKRFEKYFGSYSLYNYILVDGISFYITYQGDGELLYYWHWMNLLQSSEFYDAAGNINPNEFINSSLRICLTLKALGQEHVYKGKRLKAPCKQLQALWMRHQGKIVKLIDDIYSIQDESGIITQLQRFLKSLAKPDTILLSLGIKVKNIAGENPSRMEQVVQQLQTGTVGTQMDCLKNKSTQSEHDNEAVLLLYGLLKLVKNKNEDMGNTALVRNEIDNDPVPDKDYAPYIADPMGGIFTHSTHHRKELFKYTATFYKLLWNVSLQNKGKMIKMLMMKARKSHDKLS